jgi:hypothetical protein
VLTEDDGPPSQGQRLLLALISLGSALRRDNQRAAAPAPLERAFDLTRRGGASVLHDLARTELAATGARPRRAQRPRFPDRERTADRSASRQRPNQPRNRRRAVHHPQTVEYHLRNSYTKLNIQDRRELARALRA